jgi:hypothetical protein
LREGYPVFLSSGGISTLKFYIKLSQAGFSFYVTNTAQAGVSDFDIHYIFVGFETLDQFSLWINNNFLELLSLM